MITAACFFCLKFFKRLKARSDISILRPRQLLDPEEKGPNGTESDLAGRERICRHFHFGSRMIHESQRVRHGYRDQVRHFMSHDTRERRGVPHERGEHSRHKDLSFASMATLPAM